MNKLDANQYRENLIDALNHLKLNQLDYSRDILEMLLTQARHPTVLINLAGIYMVEERWFLAKPLLIESIQQSPSADGLANLALCELMVGAPDVAFEHAEQAIALDAQHLNARIIGSKALVQSRSEQALQFIEIGLQHHPDDLELLIQKALYHAQTHQHAQAQDVCEQVLSLDPSNQHANDLLKGMNSAQQMDGFDGSDLLATAIELNNEAIELRRHGQPKRALERIVDALKVKPDSPELLANAGQILTDLGQFEFALMHYQQSLTLNPDNPDTLNNLGNTLQKMNQLDAAQDAYQTAIQKLPTHVEAITNLATVARLNKAYDQAHHYYTQAIELGADSADLFYNRGCLFDEENRLARALEDYQSALAKDPNHCGALGGALHINQFFCRWDEISKLRKSIKKRIEALADSDAGSDIPPFPLIATFDDSEILATANQLFAKRQYSSPPLKRAPEETKHPRARIGYLSSDFGDHATMRLFGPALLHHDLESYEIHIFSYSSSPYATHLDALAKRGAHVHDITTLSDDQAAQRIQDLALDLLIDLKGFTQNNRFGILALRPCDKQATFLGYPAPINSHAIDFVIGDPIVLPLSDQKYFHEKILHLPSCYQPNPTIDRPNHNLSKMQERQKWGLPDNTTVFASFNQQYKVTEEVADTWLTILKLIPNSVLWFFSSEPIAHTNFSAKAESYGVSSDRIIRAEKCEHTTHLNRILAADICLDTFPCNGHTTTSDCLRQSRPVITVRGSTFAGRVSESLLTSAKLQELVANSPLQYIQLAERLVVDETFKQQVEIKLEPETLRNLDLFDPHRFIRNFEILIARTLN